MWAQGKAETVPIPLYPVWHADTTSMEAFPTGSTMGNGWSLLDDVWMVNTGVTAHLRVEASRGLTWAGTKEMWEDRMGFNVQFYSPASCPVMINALSPSSEVMFHLYTFTVSKQL